MQLRADEREEYDDGRIVTLALARRGEGNCRQVTSTHREGDVRQVNLEKIQLLIQQYNNAIKW